MEILEVSAREYDDVIHFPYHIFGVAGFNALNRQKADDLFYLLFKEGKIRLGIIAGSRGRVLKSPFSAPFGGFSYISGDIRVQYIEESVNLLTVWSSAKGFNSIVITLPPSFYDRSFIAKQVNCLWRSGYEFSAIELNFSFDLSGLGESYKEKIWRNARKNLRVAQDANLQFTVALGEAQRIISYEIILRNRIHRGFPLNMSWEQILETIQLIPADFFLVSDIHQSPIASAIVFHITEKIVQVVYWGDLPGYTEYKAMNFLSFKVFEYYKAAGKVYIDVGHSTDNSIPNYGLCEFKESIGCTLNPRFTMVKSLT